MITAIIRSFLVIHFRKHSSSRLKPKPITVHHAETVFNVIFSDETEPEIRLISSIQLTDM